MVLFLCGAAQPQPRSPIPTTPLTPRVLARASSCDGTLKTIQARRDLPGYR